jgi:UDP-N-acetylglucosamine acyltransferase
VTGADSSPGQRLGSVETHPTAVVDRGAELGQGVRIDAYAVVRAHVSIGAGTWIGPHAVVEEWTAIGRDCRVHGGAILGGPPQDYHFAGERSHLRIGDRVILREHVCISRATGVDAATVIGDDTEMMAYTHAGHNCQVGKGVIITNGTQLAGHVVVEDRAVLGGLVGVIQFAHIGTLAMVGGMTRVNKDVLPYMLVAGNPYRTISINRVGLQRAGISEEVQERLRRAHRLLMRSGLDISRALERIEEEIETCPEIGHLVEFVRQSQARGMGIRR